MTCYSGYETLSNQCNAVVISLQWNINTDGLNTYSYDYDQKTGGAPKNGISCSAP